MLTRWLGLLVVTTCLVGTYGLEDVVDSEGDTLTGTCGELDDDSPLASDCTKAADQLPTGDCTKDGKDDCFTLENSGSCEIQICGADDFKVDCSSVSVMVYNIAENKDTGCTATSGTYKGQTQGVYEHEDDSDNYIIVENGNTVTATPDAPSIGNADGVYFPPKTASRRVALPGPAPAPAPTPLLAPNAAPAPFMAQI